MVSSPKYSSKDDDDDDVPSDSTNNRPGVEESRIFQLEMKMASAYNSKGRVFPAQVHTSTVVVCSVPSTSEKRVPARSRLGETFEFEVKEVKEEEECHTWGRSSFPILHVHLLHFPTLNAAGTSLTTKAEEQGSRSMTPHKDKHAAAAAAAGSIDTTKAEEQGSRLYASCHLDLARCSDGIARWWDMHDASSSRTNNNGEVGGMKIQVVMGWDTRPATEWTTHRLPKDDETSASATHSTRSSIFRISRQMSLGENMSTMTHGGRESLSITKVVQVKTQHYPLPRLRRTPSLPSPQAHTTVLKLVMPCLCSALVLEI
jgi:hypothetical protein